MPFAGASKGNYCGNTIDDLRSGHFKNSYGVEGMRITGRTDWKRIVNVSDEMKQHVYEDVKKAFYKYGGMSGDNTAETDAYYDKIHSYVKSLDLSTRRAAPWTLSQLHLEISGRVRNANHQWYCHNSFLSMPRRKAYSYLLCPHSSLIKGARFPGCYFLCA